ncbi:MAG: hypothetical protein N3F66_00050 [Spirochaetes bacterium]|nr:hypothetical protein [Spirochaetota bacterium]
MIMLFIFVLGIYLVIIGFLELIMPKHMLRLWIKVSSSKIYFLYGIVLICAGFPLTQVPSSNPLSTPLFIIGLIVVFSGPFVLIYPEKIRNLFFQGIDELGYAGSRFAILVDAIARITVATLCILAYFLS